jgi:hypothetical protein
MDATTKKYIEDVLRALGQMDHKRGIEGKMIMAVEARQELIERGSVLVGLFPVKHPYTTSVPELKCTNCGHPYLQKDALRDCISCGIDAD